MCCSALSSRPSRGSREPQQAGATRRAARSRRDAHADRTQGFRLVVRGKLNKQIAVDLGTAERTVKWHRHNVMQKLQVQSLAELVSLAEHLGMVDAHRTPGDASP